MAPRLIMKNASAQILPACMIGSQFHYGEKPSLTDAVDHAANSVALLQHLNNTNISTNNARAKLLTAVTVCSLPSCSHET